MLIQGSHRGQKSVLRWEAIKSSLSYVKNDQQNVTSDPSGREVSAPEGS